LREWQRRFPERFVDAHLSLLQRRLREIRASLVASQTAPLANERKNTTAFRKASERTQAGASLANVPTATFVDPVSAFPSLVPPPESETRLVHRPQSAASDASLNKK